MLQVDHTKARSCRRRVSAAVSTSLVISGPIGLTAHCCLSRQSGDIVYDFSLKTRDHDSRTIRELRRRNTQFLEVEPLDERTCTDIIEVRFGIRNNSKHTCVANADTSVNA